MTSPIDITSSFNFTNQHFLSIDGNSFGGGGGYGSGYGAQGGGWNQGGGYG